MSLLIALIYRLKTKDLTTHHIPLLGQVDDIAVLGLALNFVEPELNAYAQWREAKNAPAAEAPAEEAPAEEASAEEAPAAEAPAGEERAEA